MKILAIVPFSLMMAAAMPASAQTDQQGSDSQAQPSQKCQAQTKDGAKQQSGGGNLTDKLNDCGGVLKPPATGDQDITAPAPDQGKTPVIKPGDVPAQPPAQ